jgi:type II secretory pathway pseudopilin PulG
MPPPKDKTLWIIVAVSLLVVGLCAAVAVRWIGQANQARAQLVDLQRRALAADRAQLAADWGEKLDWFPDPDAPLALAVSPRSPRNDFDAIYTLYRDRKAVAVLAITQVGGFFNLEPIRARQWPETLIPRRLNPTEREDLRATIDLLQRRQETFDPQSYRHGWNAQVLAIAGDLAARQDAAARLPNPPPAPGVH